MAQLDSQGENVPAEGLSEGDLPLKRPPIAHITLPEVWEAQNNDECLKIIREMLKENISCSYSQERNLSPDMRVLLKLAKQGEIRLE